MSQGGRLKHFRIYHKPGLDYLIGKTECPSLEAIVTKYHKELFLKTACPGSKFQSIFNTNKKNVCAGYLVPGALLLARALSPSPFSLSLSVSLRLSHSALSGADAVQSSTAECLCCVRGLVHSGDILVRKMK